MGSSSKRRHRSRSKDSTPRESGSKHGINRSSSNEDDSRKHEQRSKRDNKEPEFSENLSIKKPNKLELKSLNFDPPTPAIENQEPSSYGFSESLTIKETNKVREKLGLKPLETHQPDPKNASENHDGKKKDDLGEFYHKPAENLGKKLREEKLRTKLSQRKTKRGFDEKLSRVALLGAENTEDVDDVKSWINKSRQIENAKEKAEKRAKINRRYSDNDIKGLQVDHDINSFKEGETVILTLEDKKVLDNSGDVLINTNMVEDEITKKNNENKKKRSFYSNYNFDDEDLGSALQGKPLLAKYDDEKKQKGYKIGIDSVPEPKPAHLNTVKDKLLHNLNTSNLKIASDYYNEEELIKFKKPKKKVRKVREKSRMLFEENEAQIKQKGPEINLKIEDEDEDLNKIKRVRKFTKPDVPSVEDYKNVEQHEFDGLVFNPLTEFCRNLGNEPAYENSIDQSKTEETKVQKIEIDEGTWKQVDLNNVSPIKEKTRNCEYQAPILEEEPNVGLGVVAALKLANRKGYLDKDACPQLTSSRLAHLQAQNYSIEDKNYGSEKTERGKRWEHSVQEFKEKKSFKPDVKLEYLDDQGYVLDSKEAFRHMSHKFHGVGSGKNKIEKRLKKNQQQRSLMKMDSTDTPLGTLSLLQAKQKETQSPYIVISGKSQTLSKN